MKIRIHTSGRCDRGSNQVLIWCEDKCHVVETEYGLVLIEKLQPGYFLYRFVEGNRSIRVYIHDAPKWGWRHMANQSRFLVYIYKHIWEYQSRMPFKDNWLVWEGKSIKAFLAYIFSIS